MTAIDAATPTSEERRWDAWLNRNPGAAGPFVVAVRSTGIYCRPDCPARRPKPENVRFFDDCAGAERAGYRPCKRCRPTEAMRPIDRAIAHACRLLDEADGPLTLAALGAGVGVSPSHLQRAFTAAVGMSPRAYGEARRAARLRAELERGADVTRSIVEAGFGSPSRVYEADDRMVGMRPSVYRRGGAGEDVRFAVVPSSLGAVLVAATDRGICAVDLDDSADGLTARLRQRFPAARLDGDDPAFARQVEQVVRLIEQPGAPFDLPLDLRGTAFQARVWQALRQIRPGETVSYAELASRIGQPRAVRAVASACGANPVVVAIPCHRVVRSDGDLGGYRCGVERKQALLAREAALAEGEVA
jgi:AraC family transcriptional regulator of adaptative response/methylated-DNA-[protein]-cysteine methyltransferase